MKWQHRGKGDNLRKQNLIKANRTIATSEMSDKLQFGWICSILFFILYLNRSSWLSFGLFCCVLPFSSRHIRPVLPACGSLCLLPQLSLHSFRLGTGSVTWQSPQTHSRLGGSCDQHLCVQPSDHFCHLSIDPMRFQGPLLLWALWGWGWKLQYPPCASIYSEPYMVHRQ